MVDRSKKDDIDWGRAPTKSAQHRLLVFALSADVRLFSFQNGTSFLFPPDLQSSSVLSFPFVFLFGCRTLFFSLFLSRSAIFSVLCSCLAVSDCDVLSLPFLILSLFLRASFLCRSSDKRARTDASQSLSAAATGPYQRSSLAVGR